jgi:LemA protein
MKKGLIIGGIIAVILIILVGTTVSYYNRFVSGSEGIEAAWAQVENQLKRRNDLIPNLVSTVKGYMEHEQETFTHIADARGKLAGAATIPEKMEAHQGIGRALGRLLMIMENYPVLKANESFNRLMDELSGTENRIAVERMRYNQMVKAYNMLIKRLPGKFFAGLFNREAATYFEIAEEEKAVPKVEF